VGADNRVCLTLADSGGGSGTYRASLGTLVAGVATEGRIIRFDDNTGRLPRQSGVLMKQNPASFNASALSGTYAFGIVGVDSNGGRNAGAGVFTANGAGTLSNLSEDFDSVGGPTGVLTGSGSYTMATNAPGGRGTATVTINVPGGTATSHSVLYMVSSSEVLLMNTDALGSNTPILSGEVKKQTGPFTANSLDNSDYVFYATGIDGSNGGNITALGHAAFTTNGNATVTLDQNDNGTSNPESIQSTVVTIASNGRMTATGLGMNPPVFYLVNSTSGFLVGTDTSAVFGFVEKQTGGPFNAASISGQFFFGGDAPTTGVSYDSGTATFDGVSTITGNDDSSGPNGLKKEVLSPSTGGTYSFSNTSTPVGKGTVGTNSIAYVISGSKLVFMNTGTDPEVFVIQK